MQTGVVALTDKRWFDFLSARAEREWLDEVNFWRPRAQSDMRALQDGEPFFLRLKHPHNAIAGYGFFAASTHLPIGTAWEAFGESNGDPTLEAFAKRIGEYRGQSWLETLSDSRELTCIVLRDITFFDENHWVPWGTSKDWSRNIVAYKSYDLDSDIGLELRAIIQSEQPKDLTSAYVPLIGDERVRYQVPTVARVGQGAFRARLFDAYGRRCAVTGERSLPVLEAAHIQPYLGAASNHIQNGLVLRADIHKLFDAGYVTVTPQYRFEVSHRLKDDFENGKVYYALDGQELASLPRHEQQRPSKEALEWHASNRFR